MPSTVVDIFAAAGATPAGVVRWGSRVAPPQQAQGKPVPATGVYVVALTAELDRFDGTLERAPLAPERLDELLAVRPELTLDKLRPTAERLGERLAAFWLPDEVVLYIGLAGPRTKPRAEGELAHRVGEYYETPLGARGPHAGGWWLKTLSCLPELYVHYGYCSEVKEAEDRAIGRFAGHVSSPSRGALHDPVRIMPFANREFPKGKRKGHGIRGAQEPRR